MMRVFWRVRSRIYDVVKSYPMNSRILILAGGKGSRMGAPVPKAMVPVDGIPIIDRILSAVALSGVDKKPAVVIGHDLETLRRHIGDRAEFVIQHEQRGTGHAVIVANDALKAADNIVVFYGDHPLYAPQTIRDLISHHEQRRDVITMTTVTLPDFEDWRAVYTHYGRILRNANGTVCAIREYNLCTESERAVMEANNGLYCFDGSWLWQNIGKLSDENAKREFLLTDLIALAVEQGAGVSTSPCSVEEGIGVNTPEEVAIAERICREHLFVIANNVKQS